MATGSVQDTLARIETPENVWLSFRLAGPGTRLGAYLLDLVVRVAIFVGLSFLTGFLTPFLGASVPSGFILIGLFLLEWGYGTLFEGFWGGRTPGKRLLGLRVMKTGGYPIGFYEALLRNLLRAADGFPFLIANTFIPTYGVGLLAMLLSPRMQRLGDLLAATIVVREQREELREGMSLDRVERIPQSQLQAGRRPSERTLDLIETLFLRRGDLPLRRLDEIAAIIARPVADRLGYEDLQEEHRRSPARFLLRVLKTFQEAPVAVEDLGEETANDSPLLAPRGAP